VGGLRVIASERTPGLGSTHNESHSKVISPKGTLLTSTIYKKTVLTAFIDFRKAYESVDRQLVWKALQSSRLHGWPLDALKSIYSNIRLKARAWGRGRVISVDARGSVGGTPFSSPFWTIYVQISRFP
jgi:hypothetical protein